MRFARLPLAFVLLGALVACQSATTQSANPTAPSPQEAQRLDRTLLDAASGSEEKEDYIAAAAYYRALYNRDADDVSAIVGLSRSLRKLGKPVEAQAIVRRGLAKAPRDGGLLAELGKLQLALSAPSDAVDSLSRATAVGNENWDVYSALAVAYDRIGMYEQAVRRYEQALDVAPENAVVLNNYALSRGQSGDLEGAVALLERAIALPEATPRMRQNLALFYALRGDMQMAEALVRRDMNSTDAENNLAYLRDLRHSMKGAARPLRESAVRRPPAAAPAPATPAAAGLPPTPVAKPAAAPARAPAPPALPVAIVTAEPAADKVPAPADATSSPAAELPVAHHADEFQSTSRTLADDAGYRLHLGRFNSRARAQYHLMVLRGHEGMLFDGTPLQIEISDAAGVGPAYEIVAGPMRDRSTAAQLCAELQARHAACDVQPTK